MKPDHLYGNIYVVFHTFSMFARRFENCSCMAASVSSSVYQIISKLEPL